MDIGYRALKTLNAGADGENVAVGTEAGTALTTGTANIAIGYDALKTDTVGSRSVAMGYEVLLTQNPTTVLLICII